MTPSRTIEPEPDAAREWMTAQALAEALGVSIRSVYTAEHTGQLPPAVSLNGRRRWLRSDLDAWIDAQRSPIRPMPQVAAPTSNLSALPTTNTEG